MRDASDINYADAMKAITAAVDKAEQVGCKNEMRPSSSAMSFFI